jgi:hypothetical protein
MRRRKFVALAGAAAARPSLHSPKFQHAPSCRRPSGWIFDKREFSEPCARHARTWIRRRAEHRRRLPLCRRSDGDAGTRDGIDPPQARCLLCGNLAGTLAISHATATTPIVNPSIVEPNTAFGLVESQEVTGILFTLDGLPGKQLELLLDAVPGAKSIGMLVSVNNSASIVTLRNADAAAAALGVKLLPAGIRLICSATSWLRARSRFNSAGVLGGIKLGSGRNE